MTSSLGKAKSDFYRQHEIFSLHVNNFITWTNLFFFATQAIFSTLAWHGYYLQAAGVKEFMRDNIDSEMKL